MCKKKCMQMLQANLMWLTDNKTATQTHSWWYTDEHYQTYMWKNIPSMMILDSMTVHNTWDISSLFRIFFGCECTTRIQFELINGHAPLGGIHLRCSSRPFNTWHYLKKKEAVPYGIYMDELSNWVQETTSTITLVNFHLMLYSENTALQKDCPSTLT